MNRLLLSMSAACVLATTAAADNGDDSKRFFAHLKPTNEVPALITTASGRFRAKLDEDAQTLEFELSYEDLEGSVTQAHLHLGQRGVSGGIMIWLCSNLPSPIPTPPNTQACPASGTITGTVGTAQVVGPTAQNINATEFAKVVEALREGVVYANVHSTKFLAGEIRGQLKRRD